MKKGIIFNGSIESAGVTFFSRYGRCYMRSAHSSQPRRLTMAQFEQRERMAHAMSLWHSMEGYCDPLLHGRDKSVYCFISLALRLPALYFTKDENGVHAALLMPGIPVSCGTLTDITYRLDEVDGQPALVTDLRREELNDAESLLLIGIRQHIIDTIPKLEVTSTKVLPDRFIDYGNNLTLVGEEYGDPMRGWALVRRHRDGRCSTQSLVTKSDLYLNYRTEEAKRRAFESYQSKRQRD